MVRGSLEDDRHADGSRAEARGIAIHKFVFPFHGKDLQKVVVV